MNATRLGRLCVFAAFAVVLLAFAAPASAQNGQLKGLIAASYGLPALPPVARDRRAGRDSTT